MLKSFNLYTLYKCGPATVTFILVISSWEKKINLVYAFALQNTLFLILCFKKQFMQYVSPIEDRIKDVTDSWIKQFE